MHPPKKYRIQWGTFRTNLFSCCRYVENGPKSNRNKAAGNCRWGQFQANANGRLSNRITPTPSAPLQSHMIREYVMSNPLFSPLTWAPPPFYNCSQWHIKTVVLIGSNATAYEHCGPFLQHFKDFTRPCPSLLHANEQSL